MANPSRLNRARLDVENRLFTQFALEDQRLYYERTIAKHRKALRQVTVLRALMSFAAGLAAAAAGLVVQTVYVSDVRCVVNSVTLAVPVGNQDFCARISLLTNILIVAAVVAPAVAAALTTLADLFQWDRLINIYEDAKRTLVYADALSPDPEMDDQTYLASLMAFGEGTLNVMRDESAQWGQMIRQPEQVDAFLDRAKQRVAEVQAGVTNLPRGGQVPPPEPAGRPAGGD